MPNLDRPLLVVSDTHFGPHTPPESSRDLARVIDAHAGAELILDGDVFDLSHAPRLDQSAEFLSALLDRAPELLRALRKHVALSAPVTFLPGNHDAALSRPEVTRVLRARLGVTAEAPISVAPWFVRRGDVHIEHGHVYDPDNAPIHPLADWSDLTEPLGVALTRRFVARTGAWDFAHAQDSTPVSSLARAFRLYGHRAPGMIASYFKTAIALCMEAGPNLSPRAEVERAVGASRLDDFSAGSGVPAPALLGVLGSAPSPTHLCRRDVLFRLYFDRVFATLLFVASAPRIVRRPLASVIAFGSLAYLASSTLRSKDRYGDLPEARLGEGAAKLRELTGARLVVFGHTHNDVAEDGYLNTGSFAFSRRGGRPYATIDVTGRGTLGRFPSG